MTGTGETAVAQLLALSSDVLAPKPIQAPKSFEKYSLGDELFRMLERKNGFYAFESALHVFPINSERHMSLEEWNADSLWRDGYRDLAAGLLFFAEDAFQDQFCLSATGVFRFDSETGRRQLIAESIEQWAARVLANYGSETGWTLASKWQGENGPLLAGKRLRPKIPFFLGGEYSVANLYAGDVVEGMRFKADLAIQTRDVPDGGPVRLIIGKPPTKH